MLGPLSSTGLRITARFGEGLQSRREKSACTVNLLSHLVEPRPSQVQLDSVCKYISDCLKENNSEATLLSKCHPTVERNGGDCLA